MEALVRMAFLSTINVPLPSSLHFAISSRCQIFLRVVGQLCLALQECQTVDRATIRFTVCSKFSISALVNCVCVHES